MWNSWSCIRKKKHLRCLMYAVLGEYITGMRQCQNVVMCKSATSQVVTQSSHHTVNSSLVDSSHSCLVTQSTRHKWAHNKAVSCRRSSVQKQLDGAHTRGHAGRGVTENKWPEKCRTKKGLEFDGLKNKRHIVKKISESVGISDE